MARNARSGESPLATRRAWRAAIGLSLVFAFAVTVWPAHGDPEKAIRPTFETLERADTPLAIHDASRYGVIHVEQSPR